MIETSKRRLLQKQLIDAAREAKAAAPTMTPAEKRRLLAEERARGAEQRIADEEKRKAHDAEKTARLRELRLAREAALREAKAKLKTRGKRT